MSQSIDLRENKLAKQWKFAKHDRHYDKGTHTGITRTTTVRSAWRSHFWHNPWHKSQNNAIVWQSSELVHTHSELNSKKIQFCMFHVPVVRSKIEQKGTQLMTPCTYTPNWIRNIFKRWLGVFFSSAANVFFHKHKMLFKSEMVFHLSFVNNYNLLMPDQLIALCECMSMSLSIPCYLSEHKWRIPSVVWCNCRDLSSFVSFPLLHCVRHYYWNCLCACVCVIGLVGR